MNGPTLLSSQGSKEHVYKKDQAIWIALSNYLFFSSDYNNEAGGIMALALAPQVNTFLLMGWKMDFFSNSVNHRDLMKIS